MLNSKILKGLVSTEKSHRLAKDSGIYTFLVDHCCTKHDIEVAVKGVFDVVVKSVNVVNVRRKTKRFRGKSGLSSKTKKAYVRLDSSSKIDLGNVGV